MANNHSKDYSKLSKEELIAMVEKLDSRKKYGLIWDEEKVKEQFEKDAENALPVLKEISSKEITDEDTSKPVNILIEGDNYHALSVLNFTHQGKIDVIYIDPPYNTGAKDWKYNNDYVDANDPWRHSKWISLMNTILKELALLPFQEPTSMLMSAHQKTSVFEAVRWTRGKVVGRLSVLVREKTTGAGIVTVSFLQF